MKTMIDRMDMRKHATLLAFLLCSLLACPYFAAGQRSTQPDHRIAVRWNSLGILNLNAIGELEYSASSRVGLFAGFGSSVALVFPHYMIGHRVHWNSGCRFSRWGIYAGVRLAVPVGKLTGLSIKATFSYRHMKILNAGDCLQYPSDVPPPPPTVFHQTLGGYLSVAYAQPFAKRFFVEPSVGFGPHIWASGTKAPFHFSGFDFPLQLNLGVRF
jgi:hypothetical protein